MAKLILEASSKGHTYWYISPSYGAAKRTVWDDPDILPRLLPGWQNDKSDLFKKNETELKITFPHSGGVIYFMGGDRPDLMRGPNPYGVIHDEYAVQRKEVWEKVVQPILLTNPQSWAWFLFTPRGKNHAYDLKLQIQDDPNWLYSELNVFDSGLFTHEQIEMMKKQMSPQSFNQEMMCQFLEGEGSVFRHVRDIAISLPQEPILGHLYVMGVDLGRSQDYTVITVYDRANNSQVYQDRFNVLEWPYQKAKIKAVSRSYNNALVIIDATGLGSPIFDDLSRDGVPIQAFHFTNQTKKDIIEKLSISIEQRYIKIINDPQTLLEFDSYEFNYTPSGQVSYNARAGMHDDIVISHALVNSELYPIPQNKIIDKEPTRMQEYFKHLTTPNDSDEGFVEWGET